MRVARSIWAWFPAVGAITAILLLPARGEAASLPRVLILGDSISIGYTPYVTQLLDGKASVTRPSGNCEYTAYGLSHLNQWLALGTGQWDVIHFNWGIWDTHLMLNGAIVSANNEYPVQADAQYGFVSADGAKIRCSPAQYRANLSQIVDRLEQTGARLICATTTPWPGRRIENQFLIDTYNDVATELMTERGVVIDDLNQLVATSGADWYLPDGVHYTDAGYQELAKQVAIFVVPEPSTLVLCACGLLAVLAYVGRRRTGR
jgi:hypothetical protein